MSKQDGLCNACEGLGKVTKVQDVESDTEGTLKDVEARLVCEACEGDGQYRSARGGKKL